MFKKLSDRNIIEGIKNQDDKTLNWLYDNYYQPVKSHVIKNSGSTDDVSDVFQDSIIVLYNQICDNTLVLTTDLKGYFFGIARNIWNNNLRTRKETDEIREDIPDDTSNDESNESLFERIVSKAYEKLTPEYQTILTLFSEGNSYEVIAKKMKMKNENYARRKKYLSKEALMEKIKEDPEYQDYLRFQR
ncbi:MAG: sigma-70 family RNA polymerase sigma factor [Bacteroidales bacterium]|nr:sigma-70 family RNA polymerase sigma factor [Bacteroidales bacterium]